MDILTGCTVTYFSGGFERHSFSPPLFKKALTDNEISFAEISNLTFCKKCSFIEIKLNRKNKFFDSIVLKSDKEAGIKDRITSIWYCFNANVLAIDMLFSEDLKESILIEFENELWCNSMKTMRIFRKNEIAILQRYDGGHQSEKVDSALTVYYDVLDDKFSIDIIISYFDFDSDLIMSTTVNDALKCAKLMGIIIKKIIKSVEDKYFPKPALNKIFIPINWH